MKDLNTRGEWLIPESTSQIVILFFLLLFLYKNFLYDVDD